MATKARIVHAPLARRATANGVGTVSRLLSPTLGPSAGKVLVANRRSGEHLEDGLTLSRRLLELPDAFEDMGNQLMRTALASVGRKSHDGTATCAVIADAILRHAEPLLASGHDARALMEEIATACRHVIGMLEQRAEAIDTVEEVEAVLGTALVEPELAAIVAEILGTVGPFGAVKVEESRLPGLAYEYVHGSRWTTRLASPWFLRSGTTVTSLADPILSVSSRPLTQVSQVLHAVEAAASRPQRALVLIAPAFSDQVISLLLVNRDRGILEEAIAITAPKSIHFGDDILEDMATIAGAASPRSRHDTDRLGANDLGSAAEVWASMSTFGIVGGQGDPRSIETRLRQVRSQLSTERDTVRKRQLEERAGTLEGLSALVRVPNRTAAFGDDRARKVERALAIARHAVRDGVLPGGGTALARCANELVRPGSTTPGAQVLCKAMREPMVTILTNASIEPGPVVHQLSEREPHDAFDVVARHWDDSRRPGLLDTVTTITVSLETAVSVALMVVSAETLVSRKTTHAGPSQRA